MLPKTIVPKGPPTLEAAPQNRNDCIEYCLLLTGKTENMVSAGRRHLRAELVLIPNLASLW